ncbi:MAG: helix-turn-helix domain-containing protein [Gallionellaceae bacterium]|nr:helix-turn-helix domain-containing protein [Gallionellaceae bacterium]
MQKGYGQFCPLAKAAELLCERWTMIVIRELVAGSQHFNDLQRGLPLMSPTLLSQRLKQLTEAGVVRKTVGNTGKQAYELTEAGLELESLVKVMGIWGHRWAKSQFEDHDLDVGLLMWDIRRGVNSACFPAQRLVIEFAFSDAPKGMGQWWLVSENNDVDLCLKAPGHDVDLVIKSTVRALTSVWMCKQNMGEALKSGELTLLGPSDLQKLLPAWLQGSPLARMGAESLATKPILQ